MTATVPKPIPAVALLRMPAIQVALLPELVSAVDVRAADLAIVIDTLRFTTSAAAAIQAGANSVRTCQEISIARGLAGANPGWLLCGERNCKPIKGFTLGNSPLEYVESVVANKDLVFTTTNGTRAVAAALPAAQVVLASLTNRKQVCKLLHRQAADARIIVFCAGTDGTVAMEDVLTAGAIIHGSADCGGLGDSAHIALAAWESVCARGVEIGVENALVSMFRTCLGGSSLVRQGYEKDLFAAARLDSVDVIPVAQHAATGSAETLPSSVCFLALGD